MRLELHELLDGDKDALEHQSLARREERDEAALRQHALQSVGSAGGDYGSMTGTLRAQLRLGWPLRGYENCVGEMCVEQQNALLLTWAQATLVPKLEALDAPTWLIDSATSVRVDWTKPLEIECTVSNYVVELYASDPRASTDVQGKQPKESQEESEGNPWEIQRNNKRNP